MDDDWDDEEEQESAPRGGMRNYRQEANARRMRDAAYYAEAIKACEKVMAKYSKALKDLADK